MRKKIAALILSTPIIFMIMGNIYAITKMICPKTVICKGYDVDSCAVIGDANWKFNAYSSGIEPGIYPLVGVEYTKEDNGGVSCDYCEEGNSSLAFVAAGNKVFGNKLFPDFEGHNSWTKVFDMYVCPPASLLKAKPIDPVDCPFFIAGAEK